MAENDGAVSKTVSPPRPTISLPPRSAVESIFTRDADASPGPMTLVSSFFSENDPESECRSFSQLLAGAMSSPVPSSGADVSENSAGERDAGGGGGLRFKQNRPFNLVIAQSPMFTVSSGLSPASLLDSPGFFSPGQGHFGMSHQQALAQVTAQAVQSQSHNQVGYASSLPTGTITSALPVQSIPLQQIQPVGSNPKTLTTGSLQMAQSDQRSQPTGPAVDKPTDDGYNWRKYGQKQVKGSEYPRSYYKCTHPNCPVKKKVERSVDGHVTQIIYKGQHNHQKPQPSMRAKEGAVLPSVVNGMDGNVELLVNPELGSAGHPGNMGLSSEGTGTGSISRRDQESGHATTEQLSGSSDGEIGDIERRTDERDNSDELDPKRRKLETTVVATRVIESAGLHKTVTEPRIVVQTTSEVDLLDDGYRWRKYGQKVVKGNPHPRSYYKCTTAGCNVRKHVERASNDAKSVITTYEGKHNHEVPATKNSSHNMANSSVQSKVQGSTENKSINLSKVDATNGHQQAISLVWTKEEHDIM
ncbi:probable WRKY transcription factor 4 [Aristolochia californica]|uniref:probable WRKY transcription factor 4 n=1 Tax=Aristolochia californica TaxID=171875 RepID=UPI0035D76882